jgi:hypothetical protein
MKSDTLYAISIVMSITAIIFSIISLILVALT